MNPELNNLIIAARSISSDAKTFFGDLNSEQLNWKPNAESWSVGQCLEHLIVATSRSLPAIEKAVKGKHQPTLWEKLPFLSVFFGKQILKATQPENKRKFKAPKVLRPSQTNVDAIIVDDFVDNQEKFISLMESSQNLDLEKTIIASPIAKFTTYSLFDAYKIGITHERRHFRQAQNVMSLNDFPQ